MFTRKNVSLEKKLMWNLKQIAFASGFFFTKLAPPPKINDSLCNHDVSTFLGGCWTQNKWKVFVAKKYISICKLHLQNSYLPTLKNYSWSVGLIRKKGTFLNVSRLIIFISNIIFCFAISFTFFIRNKIYSTVLHLLSV